MREQHRWVAAGVGEVGGEGTPWSLFDVDEKQEE